MIYSTSSDEDGNKTENVNGVTFQTTIDAEDNSTEITDGTNATLMTASRVYDAFDRLTRKNHTSGWVSIYSNYQYATDSEGTTGNLVSNYSTSYLKDNNYQTTLNFAYSYDGNGNITDIVRTERSGNVVPPPTPVPDDEPSLMILGGDRIVTSYTYDAAGQLLEAIDGETDHIYRYTYDNCGNITSAKTYVYDEDGNEVLSESKTFSYSNGILSSYNNGMTTVSYQTDAMGNPIRISDGGIVKTLNWGEGRMLLGVQTNASNYSQYTYDVDGLRTRKVVAVNGIRTTTEYAWGDNGLAGTIIRDGTATTTVIPHYDIEGEAVGFTVKCVPSRLSSPSTTNTYTYVKNLQGDVLRILDSNGNAVVNYIYDPWGKPTVTGDEELAALNPCSYRGYDYDEETGYYYLESRYYDPQIGRFISTDSYSFLGASGTVLSYNLLIYCENNAVNMADEHGCIAIPWEIKVGLAAGVASAVWEAYKYYRDSKLSKTSWSFMKGLGKAMARGFVRGFLLGVFTCTSKSWKFGALGGTITLIVNYLASGGKMSAREGVSAFMNGWQVAVYARTVENVLKRVADVCKWVPKKSKYIIFICETIFEFGVDKYLSW